MRVKILRVQTEQFIRLHQKRSKDILARSVVVENPLPDDAEVVRVGYDYSGWMLLVIQSAEWPDVKEGDAIPDLPAPMFTTIDNAIPIDVKP